MAPALYRIKAGRETIGDLYIAEILDLLSD